MKAARPQVAIVGGGIIGLATGYSLLKARPGLRLVVIEKEPEIATHQSSHNSGVVHSGVYYKPDSLKARLCVAGNQALERFTEEHRVPLQRCGKLVVALTVDELPRLSRLKEYGIANGISGLEEIGPERIREIEPHAHGIQALHIPSTGIIDFRLLCHALAEEIRTRGGGILLNHRVTAINRRSDSVVIVTAKGQFEVSAVISCAGLYSDRVARMTRSSGGARIIPFRGDYYKLGREAAPLIRALIYPVPDPSFPFLGVHFTRRIEGEVWVGPNAVLALAREGYRRRNVNLRDLSEIVGFKGFRRLALKHGRTGLLEMWRDLSKRAFMRSCSQYLPELGAGDLLPGPSGVRAQLVTVEGSLADDFVLDRSDRILHVLNAPSPGATASLSIGSLLARWAIEDFEML